MRLRTARHLLLALLMAVQSLGFAQPNTASEAGPITLGSSDANVTALLGPPSSVGGALFRSGMQLWHYGEDLLVVTNGVVTGWKNLSGALPVTLGDAVAGAPPISEGSPRVAVVARLGTPMAIEADGTIWKYEDSRGLEFQDGQFVRWVQTGDLPLANTASIAPGATSDEIVSALGDPRAITPGLHSVIWHYGDFDVALVNGRFDYWVEVDTAPQPLTSEPTSPSDSTGATDPGPAPSGFLGSSTPPVLSRQQAEQRGFDFSAADDTSYRGTVRSSINEVRRLDTALTADLYIDICHASVRRRLKAPATAQFADIHVAMVTSSGIYSHITTVDSQNSFGALLRASVICSGFVENNTLNLWVVVLD